MSARRAAAPGRPRGKSGLPAPIPGEPFSLLGALWLTRGTLTVQDCAQLLNCTPKMIYARINAGVIPKINIAGLTRVDAKGWALILEHDNPHLKPSARAYLAAARAYLAAA